MLGPLEVAERGDLRLNLDAPRQRVVLAVLLLEANRVIAVERLVDAVWDQAPPASARSQIQICISALRRKLADCGINEAIVTRPPGYQLKVAEDDVDLHLFDRYLSGAREAAEARRTEEAAAGYRQALALCTGQPLAGVESRVVQTAAVQIAERIMTAREECVELELRLGRHNQDLIGELYTLVADQPLRERLRGFLMLALYRSGRQAEALAAYRQARKDFIDQLGLEPGEELRALHDAILTADPGLGPPAGLSAGPSAALSAGPSSGLSAGPSSGLSAGLSAGLSVGPSAGAVAVVATDVLPPAPQVLPNDVEGFTGRGDVLDELAALLGPDAADGRRSCPVVAVTGRGGVGKTALALHLAHLVKQHYPDGQLYVHLRGSQARPLTSRQALERFLNALGLGSGALPEGIEERADLYRGLTANQRMLIVVDDVPDERHVLPLIPGSARCALIVTSRLRLTGLPGARLIDLDVLTEDQAVQLLARVIGPDRVNAEPAAAMRLVALCGYLPLAIRIGGARLAVRPHWTIQQLAVRLADEGRRLDELVHRGASIRLSIADACDGLSPQARLLFCYLGMIEAADFAGWVAAPLLDTDTVEAEDTLESLVDIRLVDAVRVGPTTRYSLHDLVRVYSRERLLHECAPDQRRAALTRLTGAWLTIASAAHRRWYGGDYTVLHGEAPPWAPAASVVEHLVADPGAWFERERAGLSAAVQQAAEAGLDELCWDLAMTSVTLFETRGYLDDWRATHEAALSATTRAGNRRGRAAMLYSLGALALVQQHLDEAAEQLGASLAVFDELGDAHGSALAKRHLAFIARVRGDHGTALELYGQALAGLNAVQDRVGEAHVFSGMAMIKLEQDHPGAAEQLLARALEITGSRGSTRVHAQLLYRLGEARSLSGDMAGAAESFTRVLTTAQHDGDHLGEAYALLGLGRLNLRQSQPAQAAAQLHQALALAKESGDRLLSARVCLALGETLRVSQQFDQARRHAEVARGLFEGMGAREWHARTLDLLAQLQPEASG